MRKPARLANVTGTIAITVKATAIEGEITWTVGTINTNTGLDADNYPNRIRTGFIAIGGGVTVSATNDALVNVVYYDANYKILPTENNCGWTTEWDSASAPASTVYIRVAVKDENNGVLTVDYSQNITLIYGCIHSYKYVVTPPTCTDKGYTTHTCHCGDTYVDSYVNATGHTMGNWVETKAPTCTTAGSEKCECANCDHSETRAVEATGHSYESVVTAPTCTEKGYTTHTCHCGDTYTDSYVDALGHTMGNWVETKAPTCTTAGSEKCECANCDHSETREIEATGHKYESATTAPTCIEKGYTTHTCTTCGDTYTDTYVDATGHTYGDWYVTVKPTCTETGTEQRDCSNCNHSENREVEALGHKYESVSRLPLAPRRVTPLIPAPAVTPTPTPLSMPWVTPTATGM